MSQTQARTRDQSVRKLIFLGRVPSKKNSRSVFLRWGKIVNLPSQAYSKWQKDASRQLREQLVEGPPLWEEVKCVQLFFWAPDRRASDLTNKAESVMDLLVDNQVILDDNWYVVNRVEISFKGVDRMNPRVEVYIYRKNTNVSNRLEQ